MKTLKTVIAEHETFATLIRAVYRRIGSDSIRSVLSSGATAGFSGFTYYYDTVPFAWRYQPLILSMLEDDAEELGLDVIDMIHSFGEYPEYDNPAYDKETELDVMRYLTRNRRQVEEDVIPNLMAWYALETVCSWFES